MAAAAGLSASQLHGYLSGKNTPGLDVLDRVAEALQRPASDLVSKDAPEAEPWARVPRPLLVALSQVHPDHYPIVLHFLESFTVQKEASKLAKGLEDARGGRKKGSK